MGQYLTDYTVKPMNAAQYSMMRGVTDFTNAEQLNMYESGHAMIVIIDKPKFLVELGKRDTDVQNLLDNFCNILEYEFKSLDGIEDISAEDLEYTDGISTLAGIGKVNEQSNSEISMRFTEKSGSTITKFIKFYLNGVRDSRTQTKHYHGLIADGTLALGFENEVFNLLYLITDASGLSLEAAYLLANAWPNAARTATLYNHDKSSIESKEIDVTFKCFVVQNQEINKRAVKMLTHLSETGAVAGAARGRYGNNSATGNLAAEVATQDTHPIHYDSQRYKYKGLQNISARYGETEVIQEQL